MSDLYRHKVSFEVVTNYDKDELEEVLQKILAIPWAQYDDCDEFDYKYLKIDVLD